MVIPILPCFLDLAPWIIIKHGMLQIQCTRPFSDEDNDDDKVDMTEYKDNNQN
jgi:hypothetical protein